VQGGDVITCVLGFSSVCLSVNTEQDYAKISQRILMKPCRIMDYWHGKNGLNHGVDLIKMA